MFLVRGSVHTGLLTCSPCRTGKLEMLKAALLCLWKFMYIWKSLLNEYLKKKKKDIK